MIILVFSDSHGSLGEMISLVEEHSPDMILHLGDCSPDGEDLASIYPQIPLYQVPGNCDPFDPSPPIQSLEVQGVKLLFSHGHLWSVKQRKDVAVAVARKEKAQIVLYGHTHIADAHQEPDGLWVLNPGASTQTYGTITLENGEICCQTFSSRKK
ncbi:MAG: YfcE family phosphodiesterase [Eubacteriales bacterium]